METGPILRALFHHKTRFWLISLEIALTLAVVANCLNMIMDQRAQLLRPTGMDEDNLLRVRSEPFAPEFTDAAYVEASYEDDLRLLRSLPGVRAVTAMHHVPLSGSGSTADRRPAGTDVEPLSIPYYNVGTEVLETLGVELIAGRNFEPTDFPERRVEWKEGDPPVTRNVILTEHIADKLFPEGNAVGSIIDSPRGWGIDTVVGVIARMHCSWPTSSIAERVMLTPEIPAYERRTQYLVRVEPGMLDSLYTTLEKELLALNPGRIVSVKSLKEIKARTYNGEIAAMQMLGGLSVLLVVVTSFGIIGLTSFSVTQRTREIGTRRALGATRTAILRYFLLENWLITTAGLSLGLALTYALNYALAQAADVPTIAWTHVATGMLALWLVGLLAALAPALRGTRVPPVIATRTV